MSSVANQATCHRQTPGQGQRLASKQRKVEVDKLRQRASIPTRRTFLAAGILAAIPLLSRQESLAVASPLTDLCNGDCVAKLTDQELTTTPSGLQFKDVIVGTGRQPPIGFQAVAHVVTMTAEGEIVDNTKEKNIPYDIRVGAGQVVAGLDEGLKTMNIGGIRRLYIPGNLGFKQNLKAAPGRPRIEAFTPLIVDVQLLYVPGIDLDEE